MIETEVKFKIKTQNKEYSEIEKSKLASTFVNKVSEMQENYIKKEHNKIYEDLKSLLDCSEEKRKLIKDSLKDSDLVQKLIKSQGRSLNKRFKIMGTSFVVIGIILALLKVLKMPFLILSILISFFIGFFTGEEQPFDEVFKFKEDFSDPISKLLISRFNNKELSLEEINQLIVFLNEEEFIESFGEDETKICIKYGDEALRKVLNKVRYNYEKKNRKDLLRKIYYK